jgi:hypothetical protein
MSTTLTPFIAALKVNTDALKKLAAELAKDENKDLAAVVDAAMIGVKQARVAIEDLFLDPSNKAQLDEFENKVLDNPTWRVDLETKLFKHLAEFVDTVFTKGADPDKKALVDAIVANGPALQAITARLTAGPGVASLANTIAGDPDARKAMIVALRDDSRSAPDVVDKMVADPTPSNALNALEVRFRDDPILRTGILNVLMNNLAARTALAAEVVKNDDTRAAILTIINGTPGLLNDEILDLIAPAPGSRDAVITAILNDPPTRKAFFAAAAAVGKADAAMADLADAAFTAGATAITPLVRGLVADNRSAIALDAFASTLSTLGNDGPRDHFVKHIADSPDTDPLKSKLKDKLKPSP